MEPDAKHRAAVSAIQLRLHREALSDPIYRAGYKAPNHFAAPWPANPHRFPKSLVARRDAIACVDRALSVPERTALAALNRRFKLTRWDRWARGNYYRHCVEKA